MKMRNSAAPLNFCGAQQVFREEIAMSVEEPKKCAYQKSDGSDHEKALSHLVCGRQRRRLLKSQTDRILARDSYCRPSFGAPKIQSNFISFFFSLTFVSISVRRASIHRFFCCQGIMAHRDYSASSALPRGSKPSLRHRWWKRRSTEDY